MILLIAPHYSYRTGFVFKTRTKRSGLNGSFRVYLTKNSKNCNKITPDRDTEGLNIVTMGDISLHIKNQSHCSDATAVIELSDFTFQGLPCNLPNDITMFAGMGSELLIIAISV